MIRSLESLVALRRWLGMARLLGVPVLVLAAIASPVEIARPSVWVPLALFAVHALVQTAIAWQTTPSLRLDAAAIAVDLLLVTALLIGFASTPGQPLRTLIFFVVVVGALRFGRSGGLATAAAIVPVLALSEWWRVAFHDYPLQLEAILVRGTLALFIGVTVGELVERLARETQRTEYRADEAERLRDDLGRRVDLLEAANRCSRALSSSLDLDQAFGAFIRELETLIPFERLAIVLAEGGVAEVMASAGRGADSIFPPGTRRPTEGSILEPVLAGAVVYREDMADARHPEEQALVELGLRSRLVAPLLSGPRAVGMLSVVREEPRSFGQEEIELISLLGHLLATGVQNIRAYEAERNTVDELRRLSALRADFVSLVSHELRSPMASVIGSARTLQERWRELSPEQREAFLALIADETTRLASLIGDVLDTSRIEAGTFSFSFAPVDVGELVRETVSAAGLGQDEVPLASSVRDGLPRVRGDRARLRQVLTNLVDNAVKYSPTGAEVRVVAYAQNSRVVVDVEDAGPGIAAEHHKLIFEKFGRAKTDGAKPGTGLGLFIARSIAEAHGGELAVRSTPGRGSTFTLSLPADAASL
jgi:signal transduction histidine kinase